MPPHYPKRTTADFAAVPQRHKGHWQQLREYWIIYLLIEVYKMWLARDKVEKW